MPGPPGRWPQVPAALAGRLLGSGQGAATFVTAQNNQIPAEPPCPAAAVSTPVSRAQMAPREIRHLALLFPTGSLKEHPSRKEACPAQPQFKCKSSLRKEKEIPATGS